MNKFRAPAKDYSVKGEAGNATALTQDAFEAEVEEKWFSPEIDKKQLKQLMRRSDVPGFRHFGVWLALLISSGAGAGLTWGTWWCLPLFGLYGVMYSMSDHHAHELSHGTPFKTRWINEIFYHLNGFMTLHEGYYWRWSHTRHHTDTLLVGRDPEIAVMAPPDIAKIFLDLFFLKSGWTQLENILGNATGWVGGDGAHFIPEGERGKVVWSSRAFVAIMLATLAACIQLGTVLPALLVVTPRFYGGFVAQIFNITQHAGLRENFRDHRQNTRTFIANPVSQFLYMNMNYHIEHHMFPMVPFHQLPKLHEMIKDQCPPAYCGLWSTYRDFVPALRRQLKDPGYYIRRPIPGLATETAE
jgi:fatty acid desaturase